MYRFERRGGYEVSSKGDKRFSAFNAIMPDGRSIEHHYQCDIKGYDKGGTNWRLGKGKPPLNKSKNLQQEYLKLWITWATNNKNLINELKTIVANHNNVLSDMFATTPINQAWALSEILNNPHWLENQMITVAFVGSRKLSDPEFEKDARLFYSVAKRFAELGIIMRSGAAGGADLIAETAYADAITAGKCNPKQVEIFVPWKDFGKDNPLSHLHILPDSKYAKQTEELVKKIHPIYQIDPRTNQPKGQLKPGALKLHSRNMNQVLGNDLKSPVAANICWTEDGETTGGTASSINLCNSNGIPVFNLGRPDRDTVLNEIKEFLAKHNIS